MLTYDNIKNTSKLKFTNIFKLTFEIKKIWNMVYNTECSL